MPFSFKLEFPCSNNAIEYKAYLIGLAISAWKSSIRVLKDSNLVVSQVKGDFALREPSLASVTHGLSKLLKKGLEFTWGTEQQGAFKKLQQIMNHLSTLQGLVREKPLLLYLASSSQAIGNKVS